jgi:hypothetical protein
MKFGIVSTLLAWITLYKRKLTYFAIQKKGILTSITLSLAQSASKAISKEERYIMQNLL